MRKTQDMCLRLSLRNDGVFRAIIQDHGDPDLFTAGTDPPDGPKRRNTLFVNRVDATARKDASLGSRILTDQAIRGIERNGIQGRRSRRTRRQNSIPSVHIYFTENFLKYICVLCLSYSTTLIFRIGSNTPSTDAASKSLATQSNPTGPSHTLSAPIHS